MCTQGFALISGTLHAQVFKSQVGVLFAAVLALLVGIGCENAQETEHDAPRDVEQTADAGDGGGAADGAAGDSSDTIIGDTVDVATGDTKICPEGKQIEGCPCKNQLPGQRFGCCFGPNVGLACENGLGSYAWTRIADCCTTEAPYCGDKPPSGKDALCDSKTFP